MQIWSSSYLTDKQILISEQAEVFWTITTFQKFESESNFFQGLLCYCTIYCVITLFWIISAYSHLGKTGVILVY